MFNLSGYAAFLDYRYWLHLRPFPLPPDAVSAILSFFAWLLIVSAMLRLVARSLKKRRPRHADLARRFARPLSTTAITGLILLFFAYEQVPLLGMRLWFLVLALWFLYMIGGVTRYVVRDFARLQAEDLERNRLQKYLPNHSKKK